MKSSPYNREFGLSDLFNKELRTMSKSLLIPSARDRVDSHADLDQDELYYEEISLLQNAPDSANKNAYPWTFSPVPGFFKQTDPDTDDFLFNYAEEDLGRLHSWDEIITQIDELNRHSPYNECYKVLFLARHGEGWHNIASHKYPAEEWMKKWRFLGTDGELTWGPDAGLTELGIRQAKENNMVWKEQMSKGAPIPSKFYVSPLRRSCHTLNYTWEDINIPKPIVNEKLRETIGIHLCHKRSTKSEITKTFPSFQFEPRFSETDQLDEYYSINREKLHQQFLRINTFLQGLFEQDWQNNKHQIDKENLKDSTFVSITSHAGTIRSFITVINHRKFTIPTGGMIPIVVKGSRNF